MPLDTSFFENRPYWIAAQKRAQGVSEPTREPEYESIPTPRPVVEEIEWDEECKAFFVEELNMFIKAGVIPPDQDFVILRFARNFCIKSFEETGLHTSLSLVSKGQGTIPELLGDELYQKLERVSIFLGPFDLEPAVRYPPFYDNAEPDIDVEFLQEEDPINQSLLEPTSTSIADVAQPVNEVPVPVPPAVQNTASVPIEMPQSAMDAEMDPLASGFGPFTTTLKPANISIPGVQTTPSSSGFEKFASIKPFETAFKPPVVDNTNNASSSFGFEPFVGVNPFLGLKTAVAPAPLGSDLFDAVKGQDVFSRFLGQPSSGQQPIPCNPVPLASAAPLSGFTRAEGLLQTIQNLFRQCGLQVELQVSARNLSALPPAISPFGSTAEALIITGLFVQLFTLCWNRGLCVDLSIVTPPSVPPAPIAVPPPAPVKPRILQSVQVQSDWWTAQSRIQTESSVSADPMKFPRIARSANRRWVPYSAAGRLGATRLCAVF
ncbi:hypothetical protein C8J56DRAFT_212324 [Mycena floridula]|nr:hypothetical protein C8J56DRAFT_212324 [Mycena floridula]